MNIIPIKDLKDTSKIATMAREVNEPIFVTKNGYGELVIMSSEVYKRNFAQNYVDEKLREAEENTESGAPLIAGKEFFKKMRNEYGF